MKSLMLLPIKTLCRRSFATAAVFAASALTVAALSITPSPARATEAANTAPQPAQTEKSTVAAPHTASKLRHRVRYRFHGHHHGAVRAIAFEPSKPFRMPQAPDELALRSSVAFVVDQNTSEVLFDKNSRAVVPIASITKLMTAMVALDANLPMTDMLTVTDDDRDTDKGTGSRLSVGSVLSREDMLHIALMASENRAAAALSRYYPGGRPAFIAAMNRKAQQLGMVDTHFENPTGLTSHNVSTARDLVKLVDAAYQYPLIRQFSTDHKYDVFTGTKTIHYASTNALIRNSHWVIGLQKTGFINEAGECLVMQATIQDRPVVMVLLDSFGKYSRFADAQRVRQWLDAGGVQHVTSVDVGRNGT